jgi:K+-sensing histidine kinase KdpD
MIKILLHNIIDNARKYAPEKTQIDIDMGVDTIEIQNT